MTVHDVRHLNLSHEGEPIVEFEPDNPDGQHVVTLYLGMTCFRNFWHVDDVSPEVRERLFESVTL